MESGSRERTKQYKSAVSGSEYFKSVQTGYGRGRTSTYTEEVTKGEIQVQMGSI